MTTCLECCCSNSCEKVIELLLYSPEPLTFSEQEITFEKIRPTAYHLPPESKDWLSVLKELSYRILLNRSLSLNSRLSMFGVFFKEITVQKAQKQIGLLNRIFNDLNFAIAFP